MLSATGGAMSRENDETRNYGSLAVTRKIGRGYVSASVTTFDSAVRQVDVTLPSSYTIGFLSAGATRGAWFYDGYVSWGRQHYKSLISDLGTRPIEGFDHSPVYGVGANVGYVKWMDPNWSLTPYASLQWIKSRALREQITAQGPREYETQEKGSTLGAGVRIDRFFGAARGHSASLRVTRFETSNASAALSSGVRGSADTVSNGGKQADGWTELGGSVAWRLTPRVYLDLGATKTSGALAGDMKTGSVGARVLF